MDTDGTITIEGMGNINCCEQIALNVSLLPLTSVMHERFLSNHLECRHFRISYLHMLKQNLAKCVVILTSKLKLNRIL